MESRDEIIFIKFGVGSHIAPNQGVSVQIKEAFVRAFPKNQQLHPKSAPQRAVFFASQFLGGHATDIRESLQLDGVRVKAIHQQGDRNVSQRLANARAAGFGQIHITGGNQNDDAVQPVRPSRFRRRG